jgi:hypothetical protein
MKSELHIAKALWRDLFASAAIADAQRILKLIQSTTDPEVKWPLWVAFITSYARPFTNNADMGMISNKAIPKELRELHNSLTKARDLLYGHTDPLETLDDGLEANQLFVEKRGNQIYPVAQTLCPDDSEIIRIHSLLNALADDLVARTENGRKRMAEKLKGTKDGTYKFTYPRATTETIR